MSDWPSRNHDSNQNATPDFHNARQSHDWSQPLPSALDSIIAERASIRIAPHGIPHNLSNLNRCAHHVGNGHQADSKVLSSRRTGMTPAMRHV
ncbi:hypothetical protein WOLCODRAFT_136979 [Wolfiporia cocos MD-104 SS10]|uniref:Uncharacterized protein n=1 Tax=Wolfiporia cocos (strain MD-104) TaxID=742152 RepID=A0A2H3JVM9_WOLCO|nr:hypothetical protein WOLCODRAFT_136979 [Wolfiporia cocos MD-104 SS10]